MSKGDIWWAQTGGFTCQQPSEPLPAERVDRPPRASSPNGRRLRFRGRRRFAKPARLCQSRRRKRRALPNGRLHRGPSTGASISPKPTPKVARASCPWACGAPQASAVLGRHQQERSVLCSSHSVNAALMLISAVYRRSVRRTALHGLEAHATFFPLFCHFSVAITAPVCLG